MEKKVGVLLVHGAGEQDETYCEQFIGNLTAELGTYAEEVALQPAFWHRNLQPREERIIEILKQETMRWMPLREFAFSFYGDRIAYQGFPYDEPVVYEEIHGYIHEGLLRLNAQMDPDQSPLVVVAFSMGTSIMSNYIWDLQHQKRNSDSFRGSPFLEMKTLSGFITIGSSLPLNTLNVEDIESIEPIAFPAPELDPETPHGWKNIYDPDDVLAYPLKPLPGYSEIESLVDIKVNVGSWLQFWNPLSHLGYIEGPKSVVRPISNLIKNILDAVEEPGVVTE